MEFHRKLQQLRKQKNMTQEQLAEQLFVSRTAVSKWESGRGYPNLESLKGISKMFSVSIDQLLSNDELIELAETENRANISSVCGLIFGILDMFTVVSLFMPFFGQQEGEYIRSVTLLTHTGVTGMLRILYFLSIALMFLAGLLQVIQELTRREKTRRSRKRCSMGLHAAAIVLFAASRQPYMTVFLFLQFLAKVFLLIHENRIL